MILLFKNWRVKSHDQGGFIVQKLIGNQWKETSCFLSLAHAASYLFEQRIHYETIDIIINTTDAALAAIAKSKLLARIDQIKQELLEGL